MQGTLLTVLLASKIWILNILPLSLHIQSLLQYQIQPILPYLSKLHQLKLFNFNTREFALEVIAQMVAT